METAPRSLPGPYRPPGISPWPPNSTVGLPCLHPPHNRAADLGQDPGIPTQGPDGWPEPHPAAERAVCGRDPVWRREKVSRRAPRKLRPRPTVPSRFGAPVPRTHHLQAALQALEVLLAATATESAGSRPDEPNGTAIKTSYGSREQPPRGCECPRLRV